MTETLPGGPAQPSSPARPTRSVWPWALGTIVIVTAVAASALLAHRMAARAQQTAGHAPPPSDPPAAVTAVLRPEAGAAFMAPTGAPGRILLLVGSQEPSCAPSGVCDPPPALDTLQIMEATTGATVAQSALSGAARQPVALAVDATRGAAFVVSPTEVDVFSTVSGAALGRLSLPTGVSCRLGCGAAVTASGALLLTVQAASGPVLLGLDSTSGAVRFDAAVQAADTLDGPVYDPAATLAVVLARRTDSAELAVYRAQDGSLVSTQVVPAGTRLGPLDAAGRMLYLFEPGGTAVAIPLAELSEAASSSPSPSGAAPAPLFFGAQAVGWNHALGHVYVADDRGVRIVDAASGKTLAALPLRIGTAPDDALPVEETTGALNLLADHGALVIVHDAADPVARALTPDTAAIIARAAVARIAPRGSQNPPFVTPATFTAGPGERALSFWARDAELGSNGPYPGTARVEVAAGPPGSGLHYVRFTVTWNERFEHRRTWVYQVAPNGAVRMVSDQGDGLP